MPQPLVQFADRIYSSQRTISSSITHPIISNLAVLLLSRPIKFLGHTDIMEFFGVYWLYREPEEIIGFFETEEAAVRYAQEESC